MLVVFRNGKKCNAVEINDEKQFLKLQNRYEKEDEKGKEKIDYRIKIIYFASEQLDFVQIGELNLANLPSH